MRRMEKNYIKKLIYFITAVLAALMVIVTETANTQAATSLNVLMDKYVGTTWNGNYHGIQCKGFANYMWYMMYDVDFIGAYDKEKYYIPNVLGGYEIGKLDFQHMSKQAATNLLKRGQAGDFIQVRRRGKTWGHSMIYVSQDNTGIVVFDCNSDGKNGVRKYHISWDSFYNKNSAMSMYRANKASVPDPVPVPAPAPDPVQDKVPSIDSVKINGIDNANIGFSFSVSNGTLAKIVIESVLTGETVTKSYTSGLSNINYSFNRGDIATGGNKYHIYLYAYSGSAGNYKNERVHKMTYGPEIQCVTFPDTISNEQLKAITFNYKFYADSYSDLKENFGYNEKLLYKHWLLYGIQEGRTACPGFSPSYYLKNGDIAAVYGSKNYKGAYFHYTTYGYKEPARELSPVFSAKYYLEKNLDVSNAYSSDRALMAAIHFNIYGAYEMRESSQNFSPRYYKEHNPDLSNMNSYQLILHYILYGKDEKRQANAN